MLLDMTLNDLMPAIQSLSHADKFRLVQIVLQQLAAEDGVKIPQPTPFDPRQFLGAAYHTQQAVRPQKTLRGVLKHYNNPTLMDQEPTAWLDTVED